MVNTAGLILAGIIIVSGVLAKIMADIFEWCVQRQVAYHGI
jgi:hypothetical protein